MTATHPHDGRSFVTSVTAWACAMSAPVAAVAAMIDGARGVLAVVSGLAVAGLCSLSVARGLEAAVLGGSSPSRGAARASAAFVFRQGAAAAALWFLVPAVPVAWLLAGITAWPAAFLCEGIRHARRPPLASS
jgi:hypothetical protein